MINVKNNKGQALIEFAIILPIMLILTFGIIDFARVISEKNSLENKLSDVVLMYQNGKDINEINSTLKKEDEKVELEFNTDDKYVTIKLNKTINPITPGITHISKKIFDISVNRVIYKVTNNE